MKSNYDGHSAGNWRKPTLQRHQTRDIAKSREGANWTEPDGTREGTGKGSKGKQLGARTPAARKKGGERTGAESGQIMSEEREEGGDREEKREERDRVRGREKE